MSRVCPNCGAAVEGEDRFCTDCGRDLTSQGPTAPEADFASSAGLVGASPPAPDHDGLPPLSDLSTLGPAASSPESSGSEIVVEVEANRPYAQSHASVLKFRVTNNLPAGCQVALRMQLHGQGRLVEQDDDEIEQCCRFDARGDHCTFSFPFRGLVPGTIPVREFRAVVTRPDKPGEASVLELPDRSLSVQISDPDARVAAPGIQISGGIHLDFSQLKEMYGADIRNLLSFQTGGGTEPSAASVQWQPIRLRLRGIEAVETLPRQLRLSLPGGVALDLVRLSAGQFTMGSPEETGKADERPQRDVHLSRDFYLGRFPVTAEQYRAVLDEEPSKLAASPRHPVENVSWNDACRFCQRLRAYLVEHPEALGDESLEIEDVRLPTEAAWEYACRAGTETPWPFGDNRRLLVEYGWCEKNSNRTSQPVGQLKPNDWGLLDMLGNVWEWCRDWHGSYQDAPTDDPQGPETGNRRVLRGGSWSYYARDCRSASRHSAAPDERTANYGFRIALQVSVAQDQKS